MEFFILSEPFIGLEKHDRVMLEMSEEKLAGHPCPRHVILSAVAWFTFSSHLKVIRDLAIKQDWAVL
jgi:hypothetical protein